MRKHRSAVSAGLLLLALALTGCAQIRAELDQRFPEATTTEKAEPTVENPLPERVRRTYTVLLTTQLEEGEQLSGLSLLTFDTEHNRIHWLEFPVDLFIHAAGNDLKGHYANAYRAELIKEGGSERSALRAGVDALRKLISTGFNLPIDYFINLDDRQFTDLVKTIGNIPMTLPKTMGGLADGKHTLTAKSAISFLTYSRYTNPVNEKMEAHIQFASAFWQQARTFITAENLSLISMEIRGMMTTDIPNTSGEDMFFLRRFLNAAPDDFALTYITTRSVYSGGGQIHVLVKDNALCQLNEQMQVYEEALTEEQFDPRGVFVDLANQLVSTIYHTSVPLPPLSTMTELLGLTPPAAEDGAEE